MWEHLQNCDETQRRAIQGLSPHQERGNDTFGGRLNVTAISVATTDKLLQICSKTDDNNASTLDSISNRIHKLTVKSPPFSLGQMFRCRIDSAAGTENRVSSSFDISIQNNEGQLHASSCFPLAFLHFPSVAFLKRCWLSIKLTGPSWSKFR